MTLQGSLRELYPFSVGMLAILFGAASQSPPRAVLVEQPAIARRATALVKFSPAQRSPPKKFPGKATHFPGLALSKLLAFNLTKEVSPALS
jgi:hypothetical protein